SRPPAGRAAAAPPSPTALGATGGCGGSSGGTGLTAPSAVPPRCHRPIPGAIQVPPTPRSLRPRSLFPWSHSGLFNGIFLSFSMGFSCIIPCCFHELFPWNFPLFPQFMDCFMIGRDLVRLLQNVARIPEFEQLWKDILHNPQVLSPQFTGVLQLLQSRTSRKFLACRLTPDMETKLLFMTSRVRFGQQKRYQDWFQRQYLSTPDSQSLRCDLIRYICGVVHPSNEVLSSDILPRWAIIGWLLTTCTSNVAASNAKLALFYDWLFFNPEKDSIMNIDPEHSHHSQHSQPPFPPFPVFPIIPNFYPPLEAHVRQGVFNSLTHIVEKRVLAHLAPLFDNPKLDKELRAMLREKFPEFCSSPSPPMEVKIEEPVAMEMENHLEKDDGCYDNAEAAFSDDEEELSSKGGKKREFRFHPIKESIVEEPVDITPFLEQLDESLRDKVLQLQKGSDTEAQCEVMQEIVDQVLEEDFDSEQLSVLASCLQELFKAHFRGEVLPEEITEEALPARIWDFVHSQFGFCAFPVWDFVHSQFGILCTPSLGFYAFPVWVLCIPSLGFVHSQFDFVHSQFPDETLRSGELLNMIVAVIDSFQLQELVCHVMMGNLVMFRKDSVLNILIQSLDWETFEQYCTWQLFLAHNIPLETIIPILQHLNTGNPGNSAGNGRDQPQEFGGEWPRRTMGIPEIPQGTAPGKGRNALPGRGGTSPGNSAR
uniref:Integrator complex subunit 3 n=1 Tax=Junco hyemalis TaxID=40217 RepID=A0A8C5NM93_JUNHY